ncbi:peptidase S41 family protein [Xylariales sp. AK1849]|nr:peptidase S41 family protein [Xylariales sp. AK1849]
MVSGAPAPQTTTTAAINPNACAQISPATAAFLAQSPSATPTIAATLAYECLQSVPNKAEPAKKLIDSLQAFVQWQSTLAWLKDPPASYMLPATDIVARLDNLSTTAVAGRFASEYDFQLEVFQTFTSAHDGHFGFRPDVFKAFGFRNTLASDIVSVSTDGKATPKLYHAADLNGTTTPSAITKINGQDAANLISDLNLKFSGFQDPDSQWNSMFRTYATPDAAMTVAASLAFQGQSVTLTYDNGQEKTEESIAVIRAGVDFTGVSSGEDFYNKFCNPDTALATTTSVAATPLPTSTTSTAPTPASPTIEGYPFPMIRDSGSDSTSGYFLNGTGYEDVAVLAVSSFSNGGSIGTSEYLTNFQDTVAGFLNQSKAAAKTRLVIDLTANGGGFVIAGYELFSQLFPDVEKFQANNLRLVDSIVNIARIVESIPSDFNATTPAQQLAIDALSSSAITSNLVPGGVFRPEGSQFASVAEILAPVSLQGDLFTAYQSTPLNETAADFNLTGTGTRSNPPPAVFAPENVVLLTDGTCGSTCTLFSYLMILRLNIKTTVVGGRPTTGPMQSIAGVEGAQVFQLGDISDVASAVIELAPEERKADLRAGDLGILAEGYAIKRATDPASAGAVNGKNQFSSADSQTPLQFLMQPANCRFFYTKEMLSRPELVWQRAVDATWTAPAAMCVEGSQVATNESQEVDPLFRLSSESERQASGGSVVGAKLLFVVAFATLATIAS